MSLLEMAARCDSPDWAGAVISVALQLKDERIARANLPDPEQWRRLTPEVRLMRLAEWLTEECFEAVEREEVKRLTGRV
jgi:hypothetical protein